MRRASTLLALALVAASLAACDDMRTASHDYGISIKDFPRLPGDPPYLAIDGTVLCTEELHCSGCDECDGDAIQLSVDGAPADGQGCYPLAIGAPLTYNFSSACAVAAAPESLEVDAIAVTEASARFDTRITHSDEVDDALFGNPVRVQGASAPARALDEPLQLLAGSTVYVGVDVLEDATSRIIGYNGAAASVTLTAIDGAAPMAAGNPQALSLTAGAAGDHASAALNLSSVDLPLADVVVVDRSAIKGLEITALLFDGGDDGQSPAQLEAHLVDADGRLIHGAPVEWRVVDGALKIEVDEENPTSPVVSISETCAPRDLEATRSGTVEASSDDLKATLDLSWPGYHGDDNNLEPCGGCGCRSSDPGGLGGIALGLLILGLRRRRPRG